MVTFELPADRSAPGLARACLKAAPLRLDEEPEAELELLTSEVVSNAVRHAGMAPTEAIIVRVEANDTISVEVLDSGPGFSPSARTPAGLSSHGWGLMLLDRLAKDWRVERDRGRTKVSFEVDRPKRDEHSSA